jgi:hypothetical protein
VDVRSAVGECLDRESAEALLRLRADAEMQGRIEALADKCTDGSLSPEEREEYETLIRGVVMNWGPVNIQVPVIRKPSVRKVP